MNLLGLNELGIIMTLNVELMCILSNVSHIQKHIFTYIKLRNTQKYIETHITHMKTLNVEYYEIIYICMKHEQKLTIQYQNYKTTTFEVYIILLTIRFTMLTYFLIIPKLVLIIRIDFEWSESWIAVSRAELSKTQSKFKLSLVQVRSIHPKCTSSIYAHEWKGRTIFSLNVLIALFQIYNPLSLYLFFINHF